VQAAPPPPRQTTPPPPPPREWQPVEPAAEPPGRRSRGPWIAAAVAVLVIAGLIALWAANPFAGNSADAHGSSGASTSASQPTTEASRPAESSAAATSAETSVTTSADAGPAGSQGVDKAVKDFFKDVPKNLQAAYAQTSPGFQQQHPYANFSGFWNEFQDVKVSNIRPDGNSATVDIQYIWSPDRKQTERHVLTFVSGDDGKLHLDNDDGQGVIG
jgi:eukaryotic-like serine/threonine-protein kinase